MLLDTPLFDSENQPTPPLTLVNPTAPAPVQQADPPPNPINQTAPPQDPANQEELGTHDLKRKEHPTSPRTTPKKLRYEDVRLEVSGSQFWGFQLPANKVDKPYKDVESSRIPITLVEEMGLHPSPKAL